MGTLGVRLLSIKFDPLEGIRIFGQNRIIANINLIPSKEGIKLGLRLLYFWVHIFIHTSFALFSMTVEGIHLH